MHWWIYVLLSWWFANLIACIALIGKPREPYKPSNAITCLVLFIVLGGGTVYFLH